MSNRLTFSLASFILIFALVFAPTAVMAAAGGPTVTITDAGTAAAPSTRAAFKLKFTFSHPVGGFTQASDAILQIYDKNDTFLSALDSVLSITPTPVENKPKEYTATVDITSAPGYDATAAVGFRVTVPDDVATGNTLANSLGNQMKQMDFDLPAQVLKKVIIVATKATGDTDATDGQDYDLTITFKAQAAAPVPALTDDVITIAPSYLKGAMPVTAITEPGTAAADFIYTASITHPAGAPPVTIGLLPSYVAASNVTTAVVPPAAAVDPAPPTVGITIVEGSLNEAERTFQIDVRFGPQPKSDGSAGDVVNVDENEGDTKGFISKIKATFGTGDDKEDATLTVRSEQSSNNRYQAVIEYGFFDKLPLTLSIDPNDVVEGSKPNIDPVMVKVGMAASTNNAPMFRATSPISITGMVGTPITAVNASATDTDGDTLTYSWDVDEAALGLMLNTSTGIITGTPLIARTMAYTVTVTDETDTATLVVNVAITAAGNGGTPTAPAVQITASNHNATLGTFDINVVFTPATGGTAVTGFDYTKLTVVDALMTPVVISEYTGTPPGSVQEGLSGPNRYSATLKYNTRHTLPLKVTVNQSMQPISNADASDASATVGTVTLPPALDTRVVATKLEGALSLTDQSIIEVTFNGPVTGLTIDDFTVTGGDATGVGVKPNLPTAKANTVWQVAITPDNNPFNPVEVTINAGSTRVKAAATLMPLTKRRSDATLNSITLSEGANDQAPFNLTLTFAEALPSGVTVAITDFKLTPITAKVTGVSTTLDPKVWGVQITPTKGMDTKIELSDAGKAKFAYSGAAVTVAKSPSVITGTIAHAAYSTSTGITTITSGLIAANGFAVIDAADLPDLQVFFIGGGSITLDNGDTVDDGVDDKGNRTKGSRTVVISEILWGYDVGLRAVQPLHKAYQFIELYNTTGSSINLAGWKLIFTPGRSIPNIDIDQVSNREGAGWDLDLSMAGDDGQNGHIYNTTAINPLNRINGVRIISMYRNIHYYEIEVTHKANRAELLKRVPDGNAKGSWKASVGWTTNPWIYDSKGLKHRIQQVYQPGEGVISPTSVPRSPFVINEIGNSTGGENDWIELRNVTTSEASLKNYQLSVVTGPHNETYNKDKHKDTQLFHFHDKDYKVPAGGVVLVASTHPRHNDLAAGRDISLGVDDQVLKGLTHLYVVRSFNIPDTGRSLLILRKSAKSHEKQHLGTANDIQDVVGTLRINDNSRGTHLWPLKGTGAPHGNVIDTTGEEDFRAGKVYQRSDAGGGIGEKDFTVRGYTGVGYDRHAAVSGKNNNGTPGYANDAVKSDKSNWMNQVSISEIMLPIEETTEMDRVPRATRLPQWIEIYNNSMTEAVSLNNWYLEIQNTGLEFDNFRYLGNLHATLKLPDVIVQPNQTILIVSSAGLNSGDFPEQRTINLFTRSGYRNELGLRDRGEPVLNPKGFYIQLRDHKNNHVDEVGNLGLRHRTGRTGVGRRDEDVDTWDISPDDLISTDGHRTSLIRIYDDKNRPRNGLNKIGGPMNRNTSWIRASDVKFRYIPSLSYFGNHRDYGTPGYRGGGPLPVSLSKFRPERLKDTGEIVVRWITESELNNAGFNILRSEKRDGEFTKVHFEAGQGTTSERNVYEWKDKSAKPNVVYYYQIQDVSLDGEVTTLRVTHLRGNVTAAGKLTTTWGEIKALQ